MSQPGAEWAYSGVTLKSAPSGTVWPPSTTMVVPVM
jgi:hypothetical protein